ncbi:MAG: isocitrate lyase/phosphoenolpyruvate mutase family protein [Chitinophagaceae bacterium]|nr:isocitrate lyase/phosphoenolpyruvate mutase family protein [Chitinophagaceae bacterium]
MSSKFQQFKDLHKSADLFVLPNAWNVASALLFQANGFPAIATSSAAVAGSLGYEDGEQMPFSEYLFIIRRIVSSVQAPVSVDIEMGYGNSTEAIYGNIMQLIDLGVVGINIEDSIIQGGERTLKEAALFARTIEFLRNKLASDGYDLFINIRCDTFILNVADKLDETLRRLKIYDTTGADGIFLPCIAAEEDITAVVHNTTLPLNVMAIPGLPGFDTLQQLGVRRVSMGNFLYDKTYAVADKLVHEVISNRNFLSILS